MNNQKVLLLSATPYDSKDDTSGRQVTGLTVWLIPLNSTDEYTNGIKPVKYPLSKDKEVLFNNLELPAFAEMQFEFDFSRNKVMPNNFVNLEEFKVGELVG